MFSDVFFFGEYDSDIRTQIRDTSMIQVAHASAPQCKEEIASTERVQGDDGHAKEATNARRIFCQAALDWKIQRRLNPKPLEAGQRTLVEVLVTSVSRWCFRGWYNGRKRFVPEISPKI